jgi:hypothetical protein
LIVSTKVDLATHAVVERLISLGVPRQGLNTENYRFQDSLAHRPANVSGRELWLLPTQSRFQIPQVLVPPPAYTNTPAAMDNGIATFFRQEARAAEIGSVLGLRARGLRRPLPIWEVAYKSYQLQFAANISLSAPRQ